MSVSFSGLTLKQALQLVPAVDVQNWAFDAPHRVPTETLQTMLRRYKSFQLTGSEAAKVMLIDVILAEVVPEYPPLKVWKAAPLQAEAAFGVADYLIAPKRAYLETPLLCAIEAKRDDFDAGQTQCIAEMAVCRDNNRRDGHEMDVYGIVSNGQGWVFYQLTMQNAVRESALFTTGDLPPLLGVLHFVCAACVQNAPFVEL